MDVITPTLLRRFSSEEGYVLFDDAMPTGTYFFILTYESRSGQPSLLVSTDPVTWHLSLSLAFHLISSSLLQRLFFMDLN